MTQELLSPDFKDFLNSFNQFKVRYMLVGGYAVILHGYARSTMDMDLWVERSADNYLNILKAFRMFGMSPFDMTEQNFLENNELDVFTFGRPPICIDLLNKVKGLQFSEAWSRRIYLNAGDIQIPTLAKTDLIRAKKAAGRHKDLDDLENLS